MSRLMKLDLMAWLLLAISIFNQSTSARRILGDLSPHRQPPYSLITFFMRSVLCDATQPSTPNSNNQFPLPNPKGSSYPPSTSPKEPGSEYPNPESYPNPASETPYLSFPTVASTATLQGLDLGTVTPIEEELVEGLEIGFPYIYMGRAKGAYVVSSEDGSSHMMAMTARFADEEGGGGGGGEFKDSLSFFGVHRTDVYESHISVIGGSGKYEGANGYAIVKAVTLGSRGDRTTATSATATTSTTTTTTTLLQFTVYITY